MTNHELHFLLAAVIVFGRFSTALHLADQGDDEDGVDTDETDYYDFENGGIYESKNPLQHSVRLKLGNLSEDDKDDDDNTTRVAFTTREPDSVTTTEVAETPCDEPVVRERPCRRKAPPCVVPAQVVALIPQQRPCELDSRDQEFIAFEHEASDAHRKEKEAARKLDCLHKKAKEACERVECAEKEMDHAQKKANDADSRVLKQFAHLMADRIKTKGGRHVAVGTADSPGSEALDLPDAYSARDDRFRDAGADMFSGLGNGLAHDRTLELLVTGAKDSNNALGQPSSVGMPSAQYQASGQAQTFECQSGLATWQRGWSNLKKAWCCSHAGLGCPDQFGLDVAPAYSGAGRALGDFSDAQGIPSSAFGGGVEMVD